MKRLTAIILTGLFLTGCGSSSTDDTAEQNTNLVKETVPETVVETDGLPDKDMDGMELRFYNYDESWFVWAENRLDVEELSGELINDTIYQRNQVLEERFNMMIVETTVGNTDTDLTATITAGEDVYDVAMMYDLGTAKYYTGGLIRPWNNMPHIRFDEAWWSEEANSVFNVSGNQYAAVGDFSLSMHSRNNLYIFNKDMYAEQSDPDVLYGYVYDNIWTVDKLFEESRNFVVDTDGNGTMDNNDQYGITSAVKLEFGALLAGAGVRYIDAENGELVFALPGNTYAMDVMQKLFELHSDDTYKNFLSGIDSTDFDFFLNEHSLFIGTSLKYIERFREMDADIGFLPVPKFSEEQESYHCLSAGGAVALLPITIAEDRIENIGMLLEAMSWASHRDLVPAYLEETVKTKYTRDEDSVKMLEIILDSSFFDLGVSVLTAETQGVIMNSVYLEMNDVIASTIASMTNKVEAVLTSMTEVNT